MAIRMEHANICARDIEGMIRFLRTAFPDFRMRGEGRSEDGLRWVHVGTDETYIALNDASAEPDEPWVPYVGRPGVNHLGFEIDDVASMRDRLKSAGYRESTPPNSHPYRKRLYFYDPEGNDWEFVEYLTEDRAKRHDYELPDR
ncbi:MAG TPA: VOC family protein [Pirellulales bacterium]|nr:VOC family protein [Pirellulales bacterium]